MLGVWLNESLEKRLAAIAAKTKRSRSSLANEALNRYLEEEESKQPFGQQSALADWGASWREPLDNSEALASSWALGNNKTKSN